MTNTTTPWKPLARVLRATRRQSCRDDGGPRLYQVVDRLHEGRTVRVPADRIEETVTSWLAELGVCTHLVGELRCAVRAADWPTVHDIEDRLSISVAIAA